MLPGAVWLKVSAVSTPRARLFPAVCFLSLHLQAQEPPPATPPVPSVQPASGSQPAAAAPAAPPPPVPAFNIAPVEKTGTLPPDTTILAQKAAKAFGDRDWPAARAAYQEMLLLDEKNALAWANLGAVEQQAGNTQAALECFETSVKLNPHLAQSWNAIGLIHSGKGDVYMAISAFSRAIHEEPADARAHNYLAIAVKNLGWIDAAQAALMRAIELNPEYGVAHFNLALLYLDQKPPAIELAKMHYQKALALGAAKDEIVERRLKE